MKHVALFATPATVSSRAFQRELQRTLAFCQRYGASASLVFFDLDAFKSVNDTYGHAAGDQVLQWIASRLTHTLRHQDLLARFGSDEFVVVAEEVRVLHERLAGEEGAVDIVAARPDVDSTKMGATGGSYGGFMATWLAGHHGDRFRAFCSERAVNNATALEWSSAWIQSRTLWPAP